MKYIAIFALRGEETVEEFDNKEDAINYAKEYWDSLPEYGKNCRTRYEKFLVMESANPDEETPDHLDGTTVWEAKEKDVLFDELGFYVYAEHRTLYLTDENFIFEHKDTKENRVEVMNDVKRTLEDWCKRADSCDEEEVRRVISDIQEKLDDDWFTENEDVPLYETARMLFVQ